MFVSLWIGVVLAGGQPGCTINKNTAGNGEVVETRRAVTPGRETVARGKRDRDYFQIPKVPPPGAKIVYNSVPVSEPYIAMTFDDGPHATNTPRLLDMLKERNIKATFYVVGKCVQEYPQIVRRILAEGHEIGNHTWSHNALSGMSLEKAHEELAKTHQAVLSVAGYQMRTMRPPYGATNLRVKQLCHEDFGYPTILWSVDPFDWKRPGSKVVEQRIVTATHSGAIILAHDIHAATIDAMPGTLDSLLAKGYRFVTVSQLLNIGASAPVVAQNTAPVPAANPAAMPPAVPPTGAPALVTPPPPAAPRPVAPAAFPKGQLPGPAGIPSEGSPQR